MSTACLALTTQTMPIRPEIFLLPKIREPNELERELVASLRSGKYKQGHLQLKGQTRSYSNKKKTWGSQSLYHCCLGVLCEITDAFLAGLVYGSETYLPRQVRDLIGWDEMNGSLKSPIVVGNTTYISLSHMNDNGCNFLEIAMVIEKGHVSNYKRNTA